MPTIEEIKYKATMQQADNFDKKIMSISLPIETYNDIEQEKLDSWLNAIIRTCPLYEDSDNINNYVQWYENGLVTSPTKPF